MPIVEQSVWGNRSLTVTWDDSPELPPHEQTTQASGVCFLAFKVKRNMRDLFPSYYPPTEQQFEELWRDCIFVFDTNVLLNFYKYPDETRNDFFALLERVRDRIWIPYQVGLEFSTNRGTVAVTYPSTLANTRNKIANAQLEINEQVDAKLDSLDLKDKRFIDINELKIALKKVVSETCESFADQIKTSEDALRGASADGSILASITHLFEGKIGKKPRDQAWLDDIYLEGKERYDRKQPPGFGDASNKSKAGAYRTGGLTYQRLYGDLILWKQILEKVKTDENFHKVIFVTDDENKKDWFRVDDNVNVGGPHPELFEEIIGAGATGFYLYQSYRFLEYAERYLATRIKPETIEQVRETTNSSTYAHENVLWLDAAQQYINENFSVRPELISLRKSLSSVVVASHRGSSNLCAVVIDDISFVENQQQFDAYIQQKLKNLKDEDFISLPKYDFNWLDIYLHVNQDFASIAGQWAVPGAPLMLNIYLYTVVTDSSGTLNIQIQKQIRCHA